MQKLLFPLLLVLAFAACKDDDPVQPTADFKTELTNSASVILTTYKNLDDRTADLVAALTALETAPSQANLQAARQAWRDARLPWEQSEGFLFGPVDQQGIDPAMDSWPVNEVDLENVLNSGLALTKDYIDVQEGTVKGFHTIEFLIFGLDGQKEVADFTVREFEYLRACAQSLHGETTKLHTAWVSSGGNFISNLVNAGEAASIYPSQKAALQELVNGMVTIADEVANGKINDPFSQQNVTLEESRFSANSKADFADNMRSIRNIYRGSLSGTVVAGLSSLVTAKSATLDQKISADIEAAITAIEAIPGTFTTAIFEQQAAVQTAQNAVRDLQETLQAELLPFIQNL